jgi:hypothetical protein
VAPNVSDEQRERLTARFGVYLRKMGVDTELLDIVERNSESRHQTELSPSEWARLRIVTTAAP